MNKEQLADPELESFIPTQSQDIVLGKQIARLRTQAGLSQEELASISKLSTRFVVRLEKGQISPSLTEVGQLARTFGLTINALLDPTTELAPRVAMNEVDPEIQMLFARLKGKAVTAYAKSLLKTVIELELKDWEIGSAVARLAD
jgi:transcriptional regulator with XRE-family HTH domain